MKQFNSALIVSTEAQGSSPGLSPAWGFQATGASTDVRLTGDLVAQTSRKRAEMIAINRAMEYLCRLTNLLSVATVIICTSSKYSVRGFTECYETSENQDAIDQFHELEHTLRASGCEVVLIHVPRVEGVLRAVVPDCSPAPGTVHRAMPTRPH